MNIKSKNNIANRTKERAQRLANEVDAEVITLSDIDESLSQADIVISSTASPLPIIGKGMVERALRNVVINQCYLLILLCPRDIEQDIEN